MADTATAGAGDSAAAPAGAAGAPSLLGLLGELWSELPGLLNDRVELLSLELQRAGLALVRIVVLTVAASILGLSAWLVLWATLVMALAAAGWPLVWGLAFALLVNLAGAVCAVVSARSLLRLLCLPATRRHLMISPSPRPRASHIAAQSDDQPATGQPIAP
jgi:Putative Actinobacterial Holin-X, holin superfamily III